jgi:hypothetical protein
MQQAAERGVNNSDSTNKEGLSNLYRGSIVAATNVSNSIGEDLPLLLAAGQRTLRVNSLIPSDSLENFSVRSIKDAPIQSHNNISASSNRPPQRVVF